MSSEWQVVDTLQKKKEKLKQKRSENAIENAEKQKKRMEVCPNSLTSKRNVNLQSFRSHERKKQNLKDLDWGSASLM